MKDTAENNELLVEKLKEVNQNQHQINQVKTNSLTLGPQVKDRRHTRSKLFFMIVSDLTMYDIGMEDLVTPRPKTAHFNNPKSMRSARKTIQNPNVYFHENICKKFNVKKETRQDNLKMLKAELSYIDRVMTLKNLTGSQKRKYFKSIFNYPELN